MAYEARVFQVVIASPSDVIREREIFRDVVYEWNAVHSRKAGIVLLPAGWETHASPETGVHPQEAIHRQVIDKSDMLVAVFWTTLGSPTTEAESGTVSEIRRAHSQRKRVMIYFSSQALPSDVDTDKLSQVRAFKKRLGDQALYSEYSSLDDFRAKLSRDLARMIQEQKRSGSPTPTTSATSEPTLLAPDPAWALAGQTIDLSPEAIRLLVEASEDGHGTILKSRTRAGLNVQTNGKRLADTGNARSETKWSSALDKLYDLRLLSRNPEGTVYRLTADGYDFADSFRDQKDESTQGDSTEPPT
ncbi:MAG: DUF4062 domain-containing protein [Verrucomicrobia bacterium]|nr:DUF4062 domain-containing protein [Verrucomicrobiota bacterium]